MNKMSLLLRVLRDIILSIFYKKCCIVSVGCDVTSAPACFVLYVCVWLRPLTLLKSRLSCLPEPWYPPWDRKSLTCS